MLSYLHHWIGISRFCGRYQGHPNVRRLDHPVVTTTKSMDDPFVGP